MDNISILKSQAQQTESERSSYTFKYNLEFIPILRARSRYQTIRGRSKTFELRFLVY